jgi:spermidine synthase
MTERPVPISYYHSSGGMARVLEATRDRPDRHVGIVGLGIGALSCYRRDGERWDFYEIDQTVVDIALDPGLFTYMSTCAGDSPIHLGDARIVLEGQTDLRFDVLIVDAYSSDAVPVHLTTFEAAELFLNRTKPDGVVVYHISNRYYDISIPLARSAAALGVSAWMLRTPSTPNGADAASVVVMGRDDAALGGILASGDWTQLEADGGQLWTDDYANPLGILNIGIFH